ncbi:hypothetical protein GJU40_12095 [Bacillus lacus]|uniref:Uncharacterized protein n=1 Tax=Metabacillus lacus TaxID=1983721 RepID=A0A7X2J048_9BACI|nr:hypothetical protein [Metabacillus lacus]MRX72881.1 hypothetical protein [Metabacillus lacus]
MVTLGFITVLSFLLGLIVVIDLFLEYHTLQEVMANIFFIYIGTREGYVYAGLAAGLFLAVRKDVMNRRKTGKKSSSHSG